MERTARCLPENVRNFAGQGQQYLNVLGAFCSRVAQCEPEPMAFEVTNGPLICMRCALMRLIRVPAPW